MRLALAGGNGFIGRHLTRLATRNGHEVVWLSHRPGRAEGANGFTPLYEVAFDPHEDSDTWRDEVVSADAVVNLSGYPISSRWNPRVKHLLRESRLETARALVGAIASRPEDQRPRVYVSASGIGYYGDRGSDVLDESEPAGEDWLARLAVDWEAGALAAAAHGVRAVVLRTGVVLGNEGFLPRMITPMRFFIGGPIGSGSQWLPWIHIEDIAAAYLHAVVADTVEGPVNACAPETVRMRDFAHALGHALGRPSWFPVPSFALRLVLGEVAPYLVMSQRADAGKLTRSGFEFRFANLADALDALVDNQEPQPT